MLMMKILVRKIKKYLFFNKPLIYLILKKIKNQKEIRKKYYLQKRKKAKFISEEVLNFFNLTKYFNLK